VAAASLDVSTKKKYFGGLSYLYRSRFVTLFWPKKVKAAKLEEIHAKMVLKEAGGSTNGPEGPPKKKQKLNGSVSSSSIKINGKFLA
jgi:hypothetical protein